jgi:hypothetical protein
LEAKKRIDLAEWLGCAIPSMYSLVFFVPAGNRIFDDFESYKNGLVAGGG